MTEKSGPSSLCPACQAAVDLPIDFPASAWIRCANCNGMVFPVETGTTVLVGHGSEEICQHVGVALVPAGFAPICAADGGQAIDMLQAHQPRAAVLDVSLGGVLAFQVIEHLRASPKLEDTKVVLVSSVYSKTAYKCKPRSLYGANDYVEQHHIHDRLVAKLCHLLGCEPVDVRSMAQADPMERTDEHPLLDNPEHLQRLARRIVVDISLYNQKLVESVLRTGDLRPMATLLEEGRSMYSARGGRDLPGEPDPILAAFQSVIQEMGRRR